MSELLKQLNSRHFIIIYLGLLSDRVVSDTVTQPQNAIVANALSHVTYLPDTGYCNDGNPTDDFTYTLNGTITANVFVTVWCTYSVGGTVYDLLPGNNITLKNTLSPISSQTLQINSNGQLAFSPPTYLYILNNPYSVMVMTQPVNQNCTIKNGTGLIFGNDITDIEINCGAIFLNGFE